MSCQLNENLYQKISSSDWFIDYGNKFRSNVSSLCHRLKKGEHFVVRKGCLEVRKHRSFCEKIRYFFTKKREEAAVKSLITDTVIKLKGNGSVIQSLFFDRLAHLSTRVFDRKACITKEMSNVLCPELIKTGQVDKVARRIQKTVFALKLGIGLKPISLGASGSYFARDYKMKVVGVFKPSCEESLGSNSPKLLTRIRHFFIRYFLRINTSLPFWPNEGYLAEVMASKLAEELGIGILPPSQVTTLNEKKGSFQVFVKNTESADDALQLKSKSCLSFLLLKCSVWHRQKAILKTIKQEQFEEMALIDLTTANSDRHFENFLMKVSPYRRRKRDMVLIDHALSFPRVHPVSSNLFYSRNQYKWAVLPNCDHPFSDALVGRALKCYQGEGLKRLLEQFEAITKPHGHGFSAKTEEGSSQELAFKERIAVILIGMKEKMTIGALACIKSKEDIEAFLHKHEIKNEMKLNQFLQIA